MINAIWLGLMLTSIALGVHNGSLSEVVTAVTSSAKQAVELAIGLIGIMSFWLGLMAIAEKAGIVAWLANGLLCAVGVDSGNGNRYCGRSEATSLSGAIPASC